jgi:hypothetical protein
MKTPRINMASGRKLKLDKGTKRGLGILAVITIVIIVGAVLFQKSQLGNNPYLVGPNGPPDMGSTYTSSPLEPTDAELVCYGEKYNFRKENRSIDKLREHWYQYGRVMGRIAHCPRSGGEAPALSDEEAQRYLDGYADLKYHFKTDLVKAKEHYKVHGWKEGRIIPDKPVSFWDKTIHLIGGKSNKFFCGVSAADKSISCDKQTITPGEEFEVTKVSESQFALKNKSTNQYCRDNGDKIACDRDEIRSHEKFDFIHMGKQRISFWGPKSGTKRKWCSDEGNRIHCHGAVTGTWELFKWSEAATLSEGNAVVCENDKSKVYRYTEGQLRHYPDSETATLWDPNWGNYKVVDCGKLKIGPPMTKPGNLTIKPLAEGASVLCENDTKVYRYTEGQLRHYPNAEIATSWEPGWSRSKVTNVSKAECEKYPIGPPMAAKADIQPSSSATSTTAVTSTTATTAVTSTITPLTDDEATRYLNAYDDLKKAFGNDLAAAKKHWIDHGFKENRKVPAAPSSGSSISTMSDASSPGTTTTYDLTDGSTTVKTNAATVTTPSATVTTPSTTVTTPSTTVTTPSTTVTNGSSSGTTSSGQSFAQNQYAASSTETAAQNAAASSSTESASKAMADDESDDESTKKVITVQGGSNMAPFVVAGAVATVVILADHWM